MQSAELEAWLRLGLIPRLGPVKFRKLLSKFGDPDSALGASNSVLAGVVGTGGVGVRLPRQRQDAYA